MIKFSSSERFPGVGNRSESLCVSKCQKRKRHNNSIVAPAGRILCTTILKILRSSVRALFGPFGLFRTPKNSFWQQIATNRCFLGAKIDRKIIQKSIWATNSNESVLFGFQNWSKNHSKIHFGNVYMQIDAFWVSKLIKNHLKIHFGNVYMQINAFWVSKMIKISSKDSFWQRVFANRWFLDRQNGELNPAGAIALTAPLMLINVHLLFKLNFVEHCWGMEFLTGALREKGREPSPEESGDG